MGRKEETRSGLFTDMDELRAILAEGEAGRSSDGLDSSRLERTEAGRVQPPSSRDETTPSPPSPEPSRGHRSARPPGTSPQDGSPDANLSEGGSDASPASRSWAYLGGSRYRNADGREMVRPSFFIRPDHHRVLAILGALATPLGSKPTEVICTVLDLLGINGSVELPGVELPTDVVVPDRLIDAKQWEDLLRAAEALPGDNSRADLKPRYTSFIRINVSLWNRT